MTNDEREYALCLVIRISSFWFPSGFWFLHSGFRVLRGYRHADRRLGVLMSPRLPTHLAKYVAILPRSGTSKNTGIGVVENIR